MTVLNVAYSRWMYWDGRKDSVWSQALGPMESAVEHNGTRLQHVHLIYDYYRVEYEAIFGVMPDLGDTLRFPLTGKPGDATWGGMAEADRVAVNRAFANFGKAVEAYQRRLIDSGAPLDRYLEGETGALTASAIRGAKLFVGRASCNECHRGGTLSDGQFHNIGVPQVGPSVPSIDGGRAGGITKVLGDEFNRGGIYSDVEQRNHLDGLAEQTRDLGAFKTPTLRSVTLTAPYMHTGAFSTLRDVVIFYRDGGGSDSFVGEKDPAVRPLLLSDVDVDDLVSFLESLEGAPLPTSLVTAPVLP